MNSEKKSMKSSDLPPRPFKPRTEATSLETKTKSSSLKKHLPIAKSSSDSYTNYKNDQENQISLTSVNDDVVPSYTSKASLIDKKESGLKVENELLKKDLESLKARCERAEREKSDLLLRRLAAIEVTSNRSSASEAFKLQQKVNEMKQEIEKLQDEKRDLNKKLKDTVEKVNHQPNKTVEETLRSKLEQAEKMCEALMDENEEIKRELKNMESEMDELQDNFREEQADEYVSVKKELEQTTKNCRILSFKLKKSERKIEQLEQEIQVKSGLNPSEMVIRIKQLEDELKISNEVAKKLQTESEQNQVIRKAPSLSKIGKSNSDSGGKFSRASLTRGGSQEDPVQLLRDLQDSAEREADLREQLKFAEEEV